jgi:hypothetical protein
MKVAALALLWILTLAGAFAAGRLAIPRAEGPALESVASFETALALRDELERAHRMGAFFRALGPEELPGALSALEARNVGFTREETRLLMLAWTRFDAPAAFAWARAWPTQWRNALMEEAVYAWGFRDARSALRELEEMEDGELRARLHSALLEGWLHGADRSGASEYVAAVEDPRRRRRLAFLLAGETLRDGPDALVRWAESVPEDAPNDFKRGAFYHAAVMLAQVDPERAARWYEAQRARPFTRGALDGIARRWAAHHDAPALFAWLRALPALPERPDEIADAIRAGLRAWVQKAPEEAEAWLAAELPDPALDPAIVEVVRARARSEPASAVEWAARIADESARGKQMAVAFRSWQRQDPEAARAWLERSELPADVREAIERGAPPPAAGARAAVLRSAGGEPR